MTTYYIKDARQRVLGPVGIDVLRDLASRGQVTQATLASKDGSSWLPMSQLPEVAQNLLPPALLALRTKQKQEAQAILLELDHLRERKPADILGVGLDADERQIRQAFVTRAKKFHPARLPAGAHPELLKACMAMFQFLQEQVAHLRGTSPLPTAHATAQTAKPAGVMGPSCRIIQKESGHRLEVQIEPKWRGVFDEHPVLRLSNGSVFIPGAVSPAVGSSVEMSFSFSGFAHVVNVRGIVVRNGNAPKEQGTGVVLEGLSPDDKLFIEQYLTLAAR